MIAAALLTFELGGCSSGLLDPAGPIGTSERIILLDTTAIMLAILVSAINGAHLSAAGFSGMTLAVAAVSPGQFADRISVTDAGGAA